MTEPKRTEVPPPWIVYPGTLPYDYFWREAGQHWLENVWRVFWHDLDIEGQDDYLRRYPVPEIWRDYFPINRIDQAIAQIDEEDGIK